ncbi:TonB-dependent receptor plug domain-containing protein [Erythrobacter sp. SCSIO 43205]|uniref:TonB-dependent receptor plug domain-containing protein n=1 Tax=Erythrobacter sp. SCSIO 43205 TaxID=2779361 RepID=UPI001CA7F4F3|nr:TonB-dependent receptor plug domain-containing protein [Erythrobacter sp. SCSIO 43205]UAB76803.1 TonB-dependent receptor plug domain-containing protein [Erythrobacter sp. SCSIO 43205]
MDLAIPSITLARSALFVSSTAIAICASPALAQGADDNADTTEATVAQDASTRAVYTPEDFARFAPRSAADMARQVPGFSIRQGDGARGLGAADTNVLINGRRISGKSNGPVDALARIPVEEVVRLELVDGASLDIGGLSGQVLNVVTARTGSIAGTFRYAPQFRSKGTPARLLEGRVSLAGGGQKDEWTLSLENDSNRRGDEGPEFVFDGAGNLIDTRQEKANFAFDTIGLSGSYSRIANNGNVLNLTGEVNGFIRREREISERSGTINPIDRVRTLRGTEDEFNFELGADYDFSFIGGRLKLIGYHRYEDSPTTASVTTQFADGSAAEGTLFTRDADEGETIARGEFHFGAAGGDLVVALEGVKNFLDIEASLEVRDNTGELQPEVFRGASSRVEEDRAEATITYSRPLTSNLQLQTSLGAEYSRISQNGPAGLTRTFYRPKGFVALDWTASDMLNLSGRIERQVGQLNFFDFIASVDVDENNANVSNVELVPPQLWRFDMEANIGLGAIGTLALRPFYEDVSDIVDFIPIDGGGQAPGNIPSASRYGIEGDVTLLSDGLGWMGTRFDAGFRVANSSVRDPLLGFSRNLSEFQTEQIDFEIRHDFAASNWASGITAFWNNLTDDVRLDQISRRRETFAFAGYYIENKDVEGMVVRLAINNILDRTNKFDRIVFSDRAAGTIDFIEDRDRSFGQIFTLEIEGTF